MSEEKKIEADNESSKSIELSEEELGQVAGGTGTNVGTGSGSGAGKV